MQKKQISIVPKSMQQDLAVSQFPADAAYSIRNMRIVTTGKDTSLCLVNERSNSKILTIQGTIIGIQVINNNAILFVTNLGDTKPDAIYNIKSVNGNLQQEILLYRGNLGFNASHPIESIGIYETSDIQKVYWVDGINSPRVLLLNLEGQTEEEIRKYIKEDDNFQFDFNPIISDVNTEFYVTPVFEVNGNFEAGVVQYALSYYNKYGQSTGMCCMSPLYYTSDNGRGLNPDGSQKSGVSFNIEIINLNTTFDYVKVYRIFRTSLDATPTVTLIKDIKI